MINPMTLLSLKKHLVNFKENHPKVIQFVQAVSGKIDEGSVIELSIQLSDGTKTKTNMRVNPQDIEFINELRKELLSK
jgi:hypothetical protein